MIVARTKKGKGASEVEDLEGKHGKPLSDPEAAIEELGGERSLRVEVAKPEGDAEPHRIDPGDRVEWPRWDGGDEVATRRAYGDALAALGAERADVVALDGEVSNSTYSELFRKAHPDRYFEMFIAEQQLVAAAVGLQVRGYRPFASTFAAFFSRAYDFVRMAAISRPGCASPARTPACRSARTDRRRWRSRTSRCSAPSIRARCSTRLTPTRPRRWCG